jgi:inner membrane protein
MEPLTQGLLGAAVGRVAAPSLGGRALLWGALVGMSPDLDVLLAPLHGGYGELLYHRGTSHSLWFGFALGPPLGWLLWRWRDQRPPELSAWIRLCVLALVTHPLLDLFTPYGTQLLAPFSRTRFALHGVGIIDPAYTAILATGLFAAAPSAAAGSGRRRVGWALALSTAYLLVGVALNEAARADVRSVLRAGGTGSAQVNVYPTLLQPLMRRVVARADGQLWVGWYTPLAPGCPLWHSTPEPEPSSEALELAATWEGQLMAWFALDDIALVTTRLPNGAAVVEMEDLRYGFPGLPPERSMWGVRAQYNAGQRAGPVQRFRRQPPGAMTLATLGNLTLGRFTGAVTGELPAGCTR